VQTYDARRICLESGFTLPSALAVKKSAFESCGGFQVKAVEEGSSEDWDICFRLGKIGVLVRTLDAVTAFRLHPGNTSKTQQYSAALRYTCDFKSITRYWVLKCHELGMNRRSARAMFANRYMIRHFDLCDDHRYWCALIWLVRSMVVWPTKLDSYRYSTPFIRLKRLLVMPMLMFKRVAVN